MKLYATVTSERASKGQGGNDFLNVKLLVGNAKEPQDFGTVVVYRKNGLFCLDYNPPQGDTRALGRIPEIEQKANKQKDDIHCGNCTIDGANGTTKCKNCPCHMYK